MASRDSVFTSSLVMLVPFKGDLSITNKSNDGLEWSIVTHSSASWNSGGTNAGARKTIHVASEIFGGNISYRVVVGRYSEVNVVPLISL